MGREVIKVIRSNRRTISLEITPAGDVLVRAPRQMPETEIRGFVESKSSWLKKHLQKQVIPDYRKPRKWLKEHGGRLMLMSTYEEFSIILTVALLIVSILNVKNKK